MEKGRGLYRREIKRVKRGAKGYSLVEVLVAMLVLLVAFLGMGALSADLFNYNAQATYLNVATEIGGMQVSQLDCLGTSGLSGYSNLYTYYIDPSITSGSPSDKRIGSPAVSGSFPTRCINPALTYDGVDPSDLSTRGGLAITTPYTVTVSMKPDPNNSNEKEAIVTVSWNDNKNSVSFYDLFGNLM